MDTILKVYIQAVNESSYCTNALTFKKASEAHAYGKDLLSRWFGASKYAVIRVDWRDIPSRIDETTVNLVKL